MSQSAQPPDSRLRLAKAVMVPVWSSGFIVGTLAVRHASGLSILFWRMSIAALVMAAIALISRVEWPRRPADGAGDGRRRPPAPGRSVRRDLPRARPRRLRRAHGPARRFEPAARRRSRHPPARRASEAGAVGRLRDRRRRRRLRRDRGAQRRRLCGRLPLRGHGAGGPGGGHPGPARGRGRGRSARGQHDPALRRGGGDRSADRADVEFRPRRGSARASGLAHLRPLDRRRDALLLAPEAGEERRGDQLPLPGAGHHRDRRCGVPRPAPPAGRRDRPGCWPSSACEW